MTAPVTGQLVTQPCLVTAALAHNVVALGLEQVGLRRFFQARAQHGTLRSTELVLAAPGPRGTYSTCGATRDDPLGGDLRPIAEVQSRGTARYRVVHAIRTAGSRPERLGR